MATYEIHRKRKVRDGYEVSATLTDGELTISKLFFYGGEVEPTDKILAPRLTQMAARFAEKNLIPPDVHMMESEVVELLVEKGYLDEGDKLDDLPDAGSVEVG